MLDRYTLEIYEPGSADDVLEAIEAEHPFFPITVGDLINARTLSSDAASIKGKVLRVVAVEHMISAGTLRGDVKHKLCVFTEALSDSRIHRLGGLK
jgi:hypothetical protein